MSRTPIRLIYQPSTRPQRGAQIDNPLFELLGALADTGSIRAAADTLGQSYRHVWGSIKTWEGELGEPLVIWLRGKPAKLTPYAERLLWAERRARTRMTPHIEALRVALEQVMREANDPRWQSLEIHASHDLGLPKLLELATERQLHLDLRFTGSVQSLRELAEGRCTVAGFHVPPTLAATKPFEAALKPWLAPGEHKLIASHRRQQGLMVRKDWRDRIGGLVDLTADDVRFVNRASGSGTRLMMDALLDAAGIDKRAITGYLRRVENTHLAVAAAIAAGAADAGPGVAAAADAFGLAFVPLTEEHYYLVCLKHVLDSPALERLRETLASTAWQDALAALPGYRSMPDAGSVLSLAKTLPWWCFKSRRQPAAARRSRSVRTS